MYKVEMYLRVRMIVEPQLGGRPMSVQRAGSSFRVLSSSCYKRVVCVLTKCCKSSCSAQSVLKLTGDIGASMISAFDRRGSMGVKVRRPND